ncbi:MAG TPA: cysteine desulfurase family protein [Verrucomicrobiae bacterium]|jgi:cysteine desulfurase
MRTIYFDYNAATTLDPQVREAMLPYLGEIFGNPSSVHHIGRRARSLLDDARDRVANVWRCKPSEVVFTSGGTESNNMAIFGVAQLLRGRGRHIITSQVEHHSVLQCCEYLGKNYGFEVTYLPVNTEGSVSLADLEQALRPETILVTIMAANNETGTLQPVAEVGKICRERGILFHTDAAQWLGKENFIDIEQFNADLVSVCAHKLHGPKGSGALFIKSPLQPHPVMFGGSHENERRAGTENLASIIGLAEVMERFVREPVFNSKSLVPLTERLTAVVDNLGSQGATLRGSRKQRLNNTVAFTVRGCDSIALLAGLDLEGLCGSSGSACSAGSLEPSHVMLAMGVPKAEANSLVRFSLGRESTLEEVEHAGKVLPGIIDRVQRYQ